MLAARAALKTGTPTTAPAAVGGGGGSQGAGAPPRLLQRLLDSHRGATAGGAGPATPPPPVLRTASPVPRPSGGAASASEGRTRTHSPDGDYTPSEPFITTRSIRASPQALLSIAKPPLGSRNAQNQQGRH